MKIRFLHPVIAFLSISIQVGAAVPGEADPSFTLRNLSEEQDSVFTTTIQPDGKFLVGGDFTVLNGKPTRMFARVNADGSLDSDYPSPLLNFDEPVFSPVLMPDGKVFPGTQIRYNGNDISPFGLLNADGTVDKTYVAPNTGVPFTIWPQRDGSLVLGGAFTSADKPRYMLRLSPTGELDKTFLPRVDGVNSAVYCLTAQTDGKLIFGGTFTSVGGSARKSIARILPNGSLDRTFLPVMNDDTPLVKTLAIQADGKVLVGGAFTKISNVSRKGLARLNADGTVDTGFAADVTATGFATVVSSMIVQADGKILVGGSFEAIGGVERKGMALLNPDGSVDTGFDASIQGSVTGLTVQADGKVLANGSGLQGEPPFYRGVVRYFNYPATQELSAVSPRRVRWLRGGSSPEPDLVTFESSVDQGGTWTVLGDGVRMTGGWELTGLSLPQSGRIRARARVSTGPGNGSRGLLETMEDFELKPEILIYDGGEATAPPLADGQTAAVPFGVVRQGTPLVRDFLLENPGNGDLHLTGATVPAGFSLVEAPVFPAVVEAGGSIVLRLQLDALATGDVAGTVTVSTDAANAPVFDFPVSGTVVSPEIALHSGAGTAGPELTSGQEAAVDFGMNIQGTPALREFTVANTGLAPLLIQSITVPEGFTLSHAAALPATVATGDSLQLEVSLTSLTVGPHAGLVTILNDDLDEGSFTFPVSGAVFIPAPLATVPGSATTLNRQTGLREQTIHLANDTTATVPGYRLIVRGLPVGVTVENAAEIRADGGVVVLVTQAMSPHSVFDLMLEYASASRQPSDISPEITVEVVLDPQGTAPSDGTGTLAIERLVPMADGAMLLEFAAVAGASYKVEYSDDGSVWKTSPAAVQAAGNRCQWIDRGPPRTDSQPAQAGKRFYRVRLSPPQVSQ